MKIGDKVQDICYDLGKMGVIVEKTDNTSPFAYYWRVQYSDGEHGLYHEHELKVINEE